MTKPVTTVAALTLVEEGKLRLYDPVDAWLPELANRMVMRDANGSPDDVYPASHSITLHDLLVYRHRLGEIQPAFLYLCHNNCTISTRSRALRS